MNAATFDRKLVRAHRARAARDCTRADYLLQAAARDIGERLSAINRRFEICADIGCHHGLVAAALAASPGTGTIFSFDHCDALARLSRGPAAVADEEALPLKEGAFDLIVSAHVLHWVNDLPGALIQIRRCLKPDGLFLGLLMGGDTLRGLREVLIRAESEISGGAAPRVSPFADVRSLGTLLQRAGFALPVVDRETIAVRHDDLLAVMADLRAMGAANALVERSRRPLPLKVLERAAELYSAARGVGRGRVETVFEVICLTGWGPADSQPKALRPGSASHALADVLGGGRPEK